MVTVSGSCGTPIISNAVTLKYNATVQGFNAAKEYGNNNPVLNGIVLGTVAGFPIVPSFTTLATSLSGVGNYQISATATGANINNYELTIINSQLSITAAISTVTVSGASANGTLPTATSITISGTGFEPGATLTINGILISNFTIVGGTILIATMPAGTLNATSNVILVQNPNQLASANTPVVVLDINLSFTINNLSLTINHLPLTIHPNPTSGEFKIQNAEIGTDLVIFNAQGKVVFSQKIIDETTLVNAHLSSGIYLVKVGNQSKKLVVNN